MDITVREDTHRAVSQVLQEVFGLKTFRPYQEEIIYRALAGQSVLAILSTGAGKSLCYQLPSQLQRGPVLVISPLIALMRDQVERLTTLGIPAGALTSQISLDAQRDMMEAWSQGLLSLLYVSPERLTQQAFLRALKASPPRLLVIDEAHCISEWGYDFRPEYRKIRQFRQQMENPPLMALTATATPRVKNDIVHHLGLDQESLHLVQGDIDRPNLSFEVTVARSSQQQHEVVAEEMTRTEGAVILYVDSRRGAEEWAEWLSETTGEAVLAYHAGMDAVTRRAVEQAFTQGRSRIVAATNAFGMGIDRGDIEAVLHVGVPESLDSYYQEVGRAGRNGAKARAHMVIRLMDLYGRERRIADDRPSSTWVHQMVERLGQKEQGRTVAWQWEGDDVRPSVLLSVLEEMGLVKMLSEGPRGLRFQRHGVVGNFEADAALERMTRYWERRRNLFLAMKAFVTQEGCRRVTLHRYYGRPDPVPRDPCCDRCRDGVISQGPAFPPQQAVEDLRQWRARTAGERGLPPYMVLSDHDLLALADKCPSTMTELSHCHGIGPRRLSQYGEALLRVLKPYRHVEVDGAPLDPTSSRDRAVWLFQQGRPFDEVVGTVGRSVSTVRGYFIQWLREAPEAEWRWYLGHWFEPEDYEVMQASFRKLGNQKLRLNYEDCAGAFRYDQLQVARAVFERMESLGDLRGAPYHRE